MNKIKLSFLIKSAILISSFLLTLLITSILIIIAGASPIEVFLAILTGAFGNFSRITEILVKATPLILTGLGISIAFKGGFWNIGAEGQIYLGAIASAIIGITINSDLKLFLIPLVITGSFLAGGLWALIPGILKARFGINEIILTMMMNYIAIYLASYISHGPFRDPAGYLPQTGTISEGAWLPVIIPNTRLHMGIILAVFLSIILYLLLNKTVIGYKIRATGENPRAAFYGGINIFRITLITVFISGGLAGLAGMGEVCGIQHRLIDGLSPGYGYTGIVVALLGKLHPIGVIIASFLFASLEIGAGFMQRTTGMPSSLVSVIEAMIVIFILGTEFLEKRIKN